MELLCYLEETLSASCANVEYATYWYGEKSQMVINHCGHWHEVSVIEVTVFKHSDHTAVAGLDGKLTER